MGFQLNIWFYLSKKIWGKKTAWTHQLQESIRIMILSRGGNKNILETHQVNPFLHWYFRISGNGSFLVPKKSPARAFFQHPFQTKQYQTYKQDNTKLLNINQKKAQSPINCQTYTSIYIISLEPRIFEIVKKHQQKHKKWPMAESDALAPSSFFQMFFSWLHTAWTPRSWNKLPPTTELGDKPKETTIKHDETTTGISWHITNSIFLGVAKCFIFIAHVGKFTLSWKMVAVDAPESDSHL